MFIYHICQWASQALNVRDSGQESLTGQKDKAVADPVQPEAAAEEPTVEWPGSGSRPVRRGCWGENP